ncbi:tRNA pseudouridine(38-40) synthase TruA [Erythrobacteraceae bacterium CFH 75059]|uniref:tRNA pseudouridine(38-40) synthase TruA n=1 Tax=Qipengyuania thermophila TaxID=2509361 RepID=UPI00102095D9|nr:tRNA pseudouridine(38-40) synthase TruA [Qipengyuania thermophila]TCD02282.1 tRNA pseudouridine(38-40) synthase TruA [Erythrobacteraceae bacterium CFH 75059]
MPRYALTLEFDGAPFFGLQRQAHGPSVQQVVEDAAFAVLGERVTLHSAGRTDSGVHALAMRCHFDAARAMSAFRMQEALNARMRPAPVAVTACVLAPESWHARFSCTGRRYLYRILNRRAPPALLRGRVWHVARPLDVDEMNRAARLLVGRHDFTTFRSVHCQAASAVKTLDRLEVEQVGEEVHIHAAARSFLHHQVRSMTGCLVLAGQGRWSAQRVGEALAARDRRQLGLNAPPHGLYFVAADYEPFEENAS